MKKTQKNLEKIVSQLCWNVWIEDFNTREIEEWNVFDHGRFYKDVIKDLIKCTNKEEFAEKLRHNTMYYYWSKAEHEIVLTSWPPHIDKEELDRLNKEYEEYHTKWRHYPYRLGICPSVGKKIDVYDQLRLNWECFVNYIWSSIEEGLNK